MYVEINFLYLVENQIKFLKTLIYPQRDCYIVAVFNENRRKISHAASKAAKCLHAEYFSYYIKCVHTSSAYKRMANVGNPFIFSRQARIPSEKFHVCRTQKP